MVKAYRVRWVTLRGNVMSFDYDAIIAGAGAAGLMAAIHAAERGRRVLLLEKGKKPGVKILMSGGTLHDSIGLTGARCGCTNAGMGLRGLRALVLACCVPLVLPPGWCCWLLLKIDPKDTTFRTPTRTIPVKSAGLCCCYTQDAEQPPTEEKKPEAPRTPPVKPCPCSDRQTTPPSFSSFEPDDGGLSLVLFVPFSDFSPPIPSGVQKVVPVAHPPDCPIHVRHCVWLC